MLHNIWDIIVVGGGLAGSVLTSRLAEYNQNLKILVVEAGQDLTGNTSILFAPNQTALVGTNLDWSYDTIPQIGFGNRSIKNPAGKGLGGGTLINDCEKIWSIRQDSH